jgi:GWxTD domain-containing protein
MLFSSVCIGQITAYFNYGTFNVPNSNPFLETSMTVNGYSLKAKKTNGKYQNSVNVLYTVHKDSTLILVNKYNLKGPLFDDSLKVPSFIDNQRYNLPNGTYTITTQLNDNYNPKQKSLINKETIVIAFSNNLLQSSTIQVLESFNKATSTTALTKSGYELIPYNVNYFPESQNQLAFYFEVYNTDTVIGKNKNFIFSYYIETSTKLKKLENYAAFKKQTTAKVNPLLTKMDISKLGSGNYNLVIEVRDENNVLQFQKKYFFQRLNKAVDIVALYGFDEKKNINDYFGNCNNADTLKMFVECLWPIANKIDKERVITQANNKDKELMKKFVIDFWERYAADTANPLQLWANYYKEVQKVMVLFKCGKQPGYYSERGRVYLQYGAPNQRSQQFAEENTFPYEIWQYYRLNDKSNGKFFSNRKFVFVSKMLGDDCYNLVHSNMLGEVYNERWQFEVTRRNNNGIANPDNTVPVGTENNMFNEIYNNPR